MKNIIEMMKSNPIVVISIAVALLSIAALFLIVKPKGVEFVGNMDKRKQDVTTINTLMKTEVIVPPEKPEDPPRVLSVVVNKATNTALTQVYDTMRNQATTVFSTANEINRAGHRPMLDDLFPDTKDVGKPLEAKDEYIRQIRAMFGKPTVADKDAPRLNASDAVTSDDLNKELDKVTSKFLSGFFPRKTETELTPTERKTLAEQRRQAAMAKVTEDARRVSIYATTDERLDTFPFEIGAWAREGTRPQARELWEGQMSLWIQQDVVRAIALANRPSREPGSLHQEPTVLTAPVKHLLKIRVFDDYVGLTGAGGMNRMGEEKRSDVAGMDQMFRGDAAKQLLEDTKTHNPDKRLPEAFNVSMTGRVSNALYDVRHVQVDLIVEFRQIPALFKAIGKTNLMTVLATNIIDVDEYEYLQEGYVYGEHDCVQVQLLLETIWLREWTSPLMPQAIKDQLGIVAKPADPAAPGTPAPAAP